MKHVHRSHAVKAHNVNPQQRSIRIGARGLRNRIVQPARGPVALAPSARKVSAMGSGRLNGTRR